jgi:hypothetical protein
MEVLRIGEHPKIGRGACGGRKHGSDGVKILSDE